MGGAVKHCSFFYGKINIKNMELIDSEIGVPFVKDGTELVAVETRYDGDIKCVCLGCFFFKTKTHGQCEHIKECIALKRPDKKSVIFKLNSRRRKL